MPCKGGKYIPSVMIAGMMLISIPATDGVTQPAARAPAADAVSVDAIVEALKKRKTRGVAAKSPATSQLIEELKQVRKTRGWSMHDRARLAKATRDLAQIDLVIYFAFDSADISQMAEPVLNSLGQALAKDEYKGQTFVLAGHTDAKGTPSYNQELSQRRAEAVKRYIVDRYSIATEDLLTVGYGYEQLKNPKDPLGGENRRVQVVNLDQ